MSTVLSRFFELEREAYGKAEYTPKQTSAVMKFIEFYIRLFNPTFMSQFTTVLGMTTYFPEKKDGPKSRVRTEFHENVHKWDRHEEGIKFSLKYAFPQIVAVPFIVAAVILGGPLSWMGFGVLLALLHVGLVVLAVSSRARWGETHPVPSRGARVAAFVLGGAGAGACVVGSCIGGGLWALLWIPAALFISPWPIKAVWRRDYEIRGYTATLYRVWLEYGEIWDSVIPKIVSTFTGPAYFFMETNGEKVEEELQFQVSLFTGTGVPDAPSGEDIFLERWNNNSIAGPGSRDRREMAEPFRMISKFMKEEGMIHGE